MYSSYIYHQLLCSGNRYPIGLSQIRFSSIGENAYFDFSTFLEIVNCDFAETFIIDSMHWHGCYIKILHVGNSCNSKKIRSKNVNFVFF